MCKHQRIRAEDRSPQPCLRAASALRPDNRFTVDLPGLGEGALDEQPRHNRRVHGGAVCSDWVFVATEWASLTWLRLPTCTSATELLLIILVSGKSLSAEGPHEVGSC
jgi:hypothetical protein